MSDTSKSVPVSTQSQNSILGRHFVISKDTAEATTAWVNVLIRLGLVCMVATAVLLPGEIPLLKRFGLRSSEINILGSKLTIIDTALSNPAIQLTDDGKLLIAGLDASQVPDQIARLQQTVKDQASENANLKSNIQDLRDVASRVKGQFDNTDTKPQSGSGIPILPSILSADLGRLATAADVTLKVADENAARTNNAIQSFAAEKSTGVGVVFGGDSSPEAAMDEVRRARSAGINNVTLFQRQNSWRSVAVFETQAAATAALPILRRQRSDAYIVDLAKWCPLATSITPASDAVVPRIYCGF